MDKIKFIKLVFPNYLTSHSEPQNIKIYISKKKDSNKIKQGYKK